ncbi:MAG: hypothetical protein ACRDTS_06570, partial [Mycobacterium sp.]
MSTHCAARKQDAFADPRPDEAIFRTVSVEISKDLQSRYGDDIWLLWPMANKTTTTKLKIDFTTVPICYRETARRIIWSLINERTPLDALTRPSSTRDRLSAGGIAGLFPLIRDFFNWLHDRRIEQLRAVMPEDFRAYARLVTSKNIGREFKSHLLFNVTRIWLIAPHLPEDDQLACPTWEETSDEDDRLEALLGPPTHITGNRTAPVHPQSMSALLLAAQRFVEIYGPDILGALTDQAKMRASIPPKFQPDHREKVQAYLRELQASGRALPGTVGRQNRTPDGSDLAVEYLAARLGVSIGITGSLSGRPVTRGAPMPTTINGHVDGAPWCEAIDFYEVGLLRHYLMSACFIVTAYLSGMRAEECRALRRGCCTPVQADPSTPAHYEIRGKSFKDALDEEGNTIPGGREREQPWLVVEPVAQAIAMAEAVHDGPYVFTDAHFKTRGGGEAARAVSNEAAADSVRRFVEWWNAHCS